MKALWSLNPYFWKYRWHFLAGVVFVALTNVFAVYAPALIGEGVNALKDVDAAYLKPLREGPADAIPAAEPVRIPTTLNRLSQALNWAAPPTAPEDFQSRDDIWRFVGWVAGWQAVLYVLAFLIKGLFLFMTRQTIIVMSRHIEFDLKAAIFGQYQRLDASFYREQNTGDLMNRISEDVSQVRMYLGPAVMYTLNLVVLIAMVVTVMAYIDVELTLWALMPLPLMSGGIYLVSRRIQRQSKRVQELQSALSTFVQQHISGIRIIKAFRKETPTAERFEQQSDAYKRRKLDLVKTEALFMPIIVLLVGFSTILTIYVGGQRVMAGELELGHIFQFVFYVNLLTWPFASVGWVTTLVQKAEASMQRINDFLEAEPRLHPGTAPVPSNSSAPTLAFEGVSFTYPDTGIQALKDVSFTLERGQTVAITGRTGSGKSTVAHLAMRLFDPDAGAVRFRGEDIRSMNVQAFRAETGYVPQDVFLFSDPIEENIAFGVDDAADDAIQAAAKQAHVAHNIEAFPGGYQTQLGERGVNLSGGQKQRISIARALMRKPALLILDDSLSAVDTDTETRILNALKAESDQAAVLMMSHRVSSLRHADWVVVLDEGRVAESGSPSELIERGGLFAAMVHDQALQSAEGH